MFYIAEHNRELIAVLVLVANGAEKASVALDDNRARQRRVLWGMARYWAGETALVKRGDRIEVIRLTRQNAQQILRKGSYRNYRPDYHAPLCRLTSGETRREIMPVASNYDGELLRNRFFMAAKRAGLEVQASYRKDSAVVVVTREGA